MKKTLFLAAVMAAAMAFTACEEKNSESEGGNDIAKNAIVIGDKSYSIDFGCDTVLYNDGYWEIFLQESKWEPIGYGGPGSGNINLTDGLLGQEVDLLKTQSPNAAGGDSESWNIQFDDSTIISLQGYMYDGLTGVIDNTVKVTFKKAVMTAKYNEKDNTFSIDITGEFTDGTKFALNKEIKTVIASYAFNTHTTAYCSDNGEDDYANMFDEFTGFDMYKIVVDSPSKADKEKAYNQARANFKKKVNRMNKNEMKVGDKEGLFKVELVTWGRMTGTTVLAYVQLSVDGFEYVESCSIEQRDGKY